MHDPFKEKFSVGGLPCCKIQLAEHLHHVKSAYPQRWRHISSWAKEKRCLFPTGRQGGKTIGRWGYTTSEWKKKPQKTLVIVMKKSWNDFPSNYMHNCSEVAWHPSFCLPLLLPPTEVTLSLVAAAGSRAEDYLQFLGQSFWPLLL